MSNLESANARVPASAKSPRTWDFVETTLIGLVAYGAFAVTGAIVLSILLIAHYGTIPLSHVELEGRWQGAALVVGSPAAIIVLWFAIRKIDRNFSEYLALNWPSAGEFFLALGVAAVLWIAEGYFRAFVGADDSSLALRLNVQGQIGLLILLIGGCLAAPVMEEFIVRGSCFVAGRSPSWVQLGPSC
jgi:membrane protease YdiL (CAAX protease family)